MNILKIIKNESIGSFCYKSWHRLSEKEMPIIFARLIKHKGKEGIQIDTYDGSGQCVHPDVLEYMGKIHMVFTPYPYGIDIYENPCMVTYYYGQWKYLDSVCTLVKEKNIGYHLSDPCLFADSAEKKLILVYRRTKKYVDRSSCLYVMYSENGTEWSFPELLQLKGHNDYISPAIVESGQVYLFYINICENKNVMKVLSGRSLFELNSEDNVLLKSFDNEDIWHIGLASENNWNSKISNNKRFDCLITTVNKNEQYKLYYGKLFYSNGWILEKKKFIDIKNQKIVYKSAFAILDGKKCIIVSSKDKENRFIIQEFFV